MFRKAQVYLEKEWILDKNRKPLVVRGARQVGKTWLARAVAKNTKKQLIEINFERDPNLKNLFAGNDPKSIIRNLELLFSKTIDPSKSILFLDEIQDAPELLAKLRWFYEELPELAVIVAGSLLEFIIQDHAFSMPVGRITYLHLEPLSFEEFLRANKKEKLSQFLSDVDKSMEINPMIHETLTEQFQIYSFIGGMPEAVNTYIKTQSYESVIKIHQDLLSTYRDDFFKYKGRLDIHRLDSILNAIPAQLGEKFVFSKADKNIQATTAKQILSLFNKARLAHKVSRSLGNSVPLESEVQDKSFKQIFLDVGLASRALGSISPFIKNQMQGAISEQIVGQMLRCSFPFFLEPMLYYWQRDENGSSAEIDYLIESNQKIIPIEVKSGSTGSLKSLHSFMFRKNGKIAVRINNDVLSMAEVSVMVENGKQVNYKLLSIPFYLVGQLYKLLDTLISD